MLYNADQAALTLEKEWPGGPWQLKVLGHGAEEDATELAMADLQANGFLQYVRIKLEVALHLTAAVVLAPEGPSRNEHAGVFDSWGMDSAGHPQEASFWSRFAEHLLGEHAPDALSLHLRTQNPWDHRWEVTHTRADGLGLRYTVNVYFQNGVHATATVNLITLTSETGSQVFTRTMDHIQDTQSLQRTRLGNTVDGPSLELEVESPELHLHDGEWNPVPNLLRIRNIDTAVHAKIKFRPNYIGILRKAVEAVGKGVLREVGQVILTDLIPTAAAAVAADGTEVSLAAFVGLDGGVAMSGFVITVATVMLAFRDMDSGTDAVAHTHQLLDQCVHNAYLGASGTPGPAENQQDLGWQAWNYGVQLLLQAGTAEQSAHTNLTQDQAYEQIRAQIAAPRNEAQVRDRLRRNLNTPVGMIGFVSYYRQCHSRSYWTNMSNVYMRTYYGPDWGDDPRLQNMWNYFMNNGNDSSGSLGPR